MMVLQGPHLPSCLNHLENWTKYMKQQFSDIGQQAAQDTDPWEKGNKSSESYGYPHFRPLCRKRKPKQSLTISLHWECLEFREAKVGNIFREVLEPKSMEINTERTVELCRSLSRSWLNILKIKLSRLRKESFESRSWNNLPVVWKPFWWRG